MNKIYFVGGSPCAGKSTICEIIANKYNLHYFKVDDFLDHYMNLAVKDNLPICKKASIMKSDEIWMRDPKLQSDEEFGIYKEIFEYIIHDLKKISPDRDIIAEGCAFIPSLIHDLGIKATNYISIVPTKNFQITHYKKRSFVKIILKDCQNKTESFRNWMERDNIFAKEILIECRNLGYKIIINDGRTSIEELVNEVTTHFKIK